MLLAVYTISIKKSTGKRLYSCFNLCSNGILSDSTHIRSIISYHSFREDRHRSSYLIVHQYGGCFLFPFVILKVTTSHENALYKDRIVDMENPDFGEPPSPNLYRFGDPDSPSQ